MSERASPAEVEELRAVFERAVGNRDSYGLRRSRRGTYINPAIARDWKWFQLGAATIAEATASRQVAEQIKANGADVDAKRISWEEFNARQRQAWDSVSRGELNIIGSACSRRIAMVHKALAASDEQAAASAAT